MDLGQFGPRICRSTNKDDGLQSIYLHTALFLNYFRTQIAFSTSFRSMRHQRMKRLKFREFLWSIHRMQIWRTARLSPGTSRMKARLVSLRCFAVTIFPQKVLLCGRSGLLYVAFFCCVSECHEKGYKSSTVRLLSSGKIMDQCNSFRRRKLRS